MKNFAETATRHFAKTKSNVQPHQTAADADGYVRYPGKTGDFNNPIYNYEFDRTCNDYEAFWGEQAQEVAWMKPPKTVIDMSHPHLHRWFPDGVMNIGYNAVDRHVDNGRGGEKALIYESAYTGKSETYTFRELQKEVAQLAYVMQNKFGVQKGDRVLIYMPMVPQAFFAMLACARIGAVHCAVFGGFAAKELATRVDDCQPKLILTSSAGIEPTKVLPYPPLVDEALSKWCKLPGADKIPRFIYQRNCRPDGSLRTDDVDPAVYHDWEKTMTSQVWPEAAPMPMQSTDPLYILYTSGTTGAPKGIYRDHGSTAVGLNYGMKNVFGVMPEDTHFAVSDIGWIVGHTNIVYGTMMRGATTVFFEGKPIVPDAGIIWRICAKHKVNSLFMAPTGVRVVKKDDHEAKLAAKCDLSALRSFQLAGERCDPDTVLWLHKYFPQAIVNDTWWQTEVCWPICGNLENTGKFGPVFPTLPGSATKPVPGFNVQVLDDNNKRCKPGQLGKVAIKLPMPPAFMLSIWNRDKDFVEKYLAEAPGYYVSGDAGVCDANGYISIMARTDDVINTAGHRISTGRLEEVLNEHELVVESAVIGMVDDMTEKPFAYCILRGDVAGMSQKDKEALAVELNNKVRKDAGAFCRLRGCLFLDRLPKTRSGKILRGTIRSIANQEKYKAPATIEDTAALDEVEAAMAAWRKANPAKKEKVKFAKL